MGHAAHPGNPVSAAHGGLCLDLKEKGPPVSAPYEFADNAWEIDRSLSNFEMQVVFHGVPASVVMHVDMDDAIEVLLEEVVRLVLFGKKLRVADVEGEA